MKAKTNRLTIYMQLLVMQILSPRVRRQFRPTRLLSHIYTLGQAELILDLLKTSLYYEYCRSVA